MKYVGLSQNMNENPQDRILPFAQSDTVFRFLQGVDPKFSKDSEGYIDELIEEITLHVFASTSDLYESDVLREEAALTFSTNLFESRQRYSNKLSLLKQTRFVAPVFDVIDSLPKERI